MVKKSELGLNIMNDRSNIVKIKSVKAKMSLGDSVIAKKKVKQLHFEHIEQILERK